MEFLCRTLLSIIDLEKLSNRPSSRLAAVATLAAPVEDAWLATDKLEHFCFCAAVVVATYLASLRVSRAARYRLPLSAGCSVLAGVIKELGDYLKVPR